jgi:hypothetical protein
MEDAGMRMTRAERGDFRFEDPRQAELYDLLRRLVGEGPASFYRDSCWHMAMGPPMEAVTHQVGHLVREIDAALLGMLGSVTSSGDLEEDDPLEDENRRQAVEAVMETFSISENARANKAKSLVSALTQESRSQRIHSVLDALDIPEDDPIRGPWISPSRGAHSWAHRDQLLPPRPLNDEFRQFWEQMQKVWLVVLRRFETRFTDSFPLIDRLLLLEHPTNDDVSEFQAGVPNTVVTYEYFFAKMTDARWIDPLRRKHFFDRPPGPEVNEDGTVFVPPWPQSRLLARIAGVDPDKVKEVILGAPTTANVLVHEDFTEAALIMSPRLAAEVVPKATGGLDSPYYTSVLPRNLGKLVAHLAGGGLTEEAFGLARELLVVVPQEGQGEEAALLTTRDPRPRFRPPEIYGEVIEACLVPLVRAAGERAFDTLCDLLEDAIRVSLDLRTGEEAEELPYEDGLYVLRPAIEDSPYNADRGQLGEMSIYYLLSAVRDAGDRIAVADPSAVPRLIQALESKRNETFDRLALHLLRNVPDAPGVPDLIAERLKDRLASSSPGLFHEYALLLRDRFEDLSAEDRDEILRRINEGPPQEELESMRRYREHG